MNRLTVGELSSPRGFYGKIRRKNFLGLGPWSIGVVCLEGLGRYERGLVGDLSLIKLMSRLRGRWVEGHETAELLAPYGEWSGLASVYLTTAFKHGLIRQPAFA